MLPQAGLGLGFFGKTPENSLEKSLGEADEVVQSGQCSLCKLKDLNSVPRAHIKLLYTVLHTLKISSGETGTGGSP